MQLTLFPSTAAQIAPPSRPSPARYDYDSLRGRQVVLEGFSKPGTCTSACGEIAVITLGAGPHIGQLRCARCHGPRGWLSREQADGILAFIRLCGRLEAAPIIRRRARS